MTDDDQMSLSELEPLRDRRGYVRGTATLPGFHLNRPSALSGKKLPPLILREKFILRMLEECGDDFSGRRLAAYIALSWRTGVEIMEALTLRIGDLDLTPGVEAAAVTATRLIDRRLALDPFAVRYLRAWLAVRCQLPGDHVLCVVEGNTAGSDWSDSDVRRALKRVAAAVEHRYGEVLERSITTRDLRLTLLAELMLEQWPLPYLQTQFGLTTLETFRVVLPQLGIHPAEQEEVEHIARARPLPLEDSP